MQFLSLSAFDAARRAAILDRVHARVAVARESFGLRASASGSTAIIPLMGEVWRRSGTFQPFVTDIDDFRGAVNAAAADSKTERIILAIDSPGGSVDGLREAAEAVASANRVKPVTAVIEGMGASAAYYIASQAGRVLAGPMDMVGSIGTIIVLLDASKMAADMGLKVIPIATGKFKQTGIMGLEVTEEEIAYVRGLVEAYGADFRAAVARGRRMTAAQVEDLADGRVWLASDAMKLGLIDGIGSIAGVLAEAERQGRVRAASAEIGILALTSRKP